MPGQLKIGKTKDPESRAKELHSTGVATPFVIEALFKVKDRAKAEVAVHRKLKSYRVAENREFFKCDLKTAFYEANAILRERGEFISVEDRNAMAAEAERRRQEEIEHQEYERRKKDGRDRLLENAILALEMQESGKSLVEVGHHFLREGRYKPKGDAYATFDLEKLIAGMKGQREKEKKIKEAEEKRRLQEEQEGIDFVYLFAMVLVTILMFGLGIYGLAER